MKGYRIGLHCYNVEGSAHLTFTYYVNAEDLSSAIDKAEAHARRVKGEGRVEFSHGDLLDGWHYVIP